MADRSHLRLLPPPDMSVPRDSAIGHAVISAAGIDPDDVGASMARLASVLPSVNEAATAILDAFAALPSIDAETSAEIDAALFGTKVEQDRP